MTAAKTKAIQFSQIFVTYTDIERDRRSWIFNFKEQRPNKVEFILVQWSDQCVASAVTLPVKLTRMDSGQRVAELVNMTMKQCKSEVVMEAEWTTDTKHIWHFSTVVMRACILVFKLHRAKGPSKYVHKNKQQFHKAQMSIREGRRFKIYCELNWSKQAKRQRHSRNRT